MNTHYREVDYREDWMRELFLSLNHGFVSIGEKLNSIEWFDGVFAQEQAETILGIAFVSAQTYITGTIADMSAIKGQSYRSFKTEALSTGSPIVVDEITKVALINTIANYYKHNEEWENWNATGHNKITIEILNKCGITEQSESPCREAAELIWPTEVISELMYMLDVLIEWRKNLLLHVKNI